MELRGMRSLVTGGGSGIGLSIARRLAETGPVAIFGRDAERMAKAVAGVPGLRPWVVDIVDEEATAEGINHVVEALGGLDLVVNNAGVMQRYQTVGDDTAARAERDFAINVLGSLRVTRLALPHLRASADGAVVFISSVMAIAPAPGYGVYSASKAAVHSLVRTLRHELGPVKVFEVLPTFVDTRQAEELHVSKLDPNQVADALVKGLAADRLEIGVGRAGAVALASRLSPSLAEALIARASR